MALLIGPCTWRQCRAFRALLLQYFHEELHLPLTRRQSVTLARGILRESRRGVPLELAVQAGRPVGFIDYQIDWPGSSWCFHEGWGCVRECYVCPAARGQGVGRALAQRALGWMAAQGAVRAYLTADAGIPFWRHMGFVPSGRRNPKNDMQELEMPLPAARENGGAPS